MSDILPTPEDISGFERSSGDPGLTDSSSGSAQHTVRRPRPPSCAGLVVGSFFDKAYKALPKVPKSPLTALSYSLSLSLCERTLNTHHGQTTDSERHGSRGNVTASPSALCAITVPFQAQSQLAASLGC